MNILHLCDTPLSGAPLNLSMTLDRMDGVHYSKLISHRNKYAPQSNMAYEHDIILSKGENNKEVKEHLKGVKPVVEYLFKTADVIHCHNFLDTQKVFKFFPDNLKYLETKPVFMQFHSPRASITEVDKIIQDPRVDQRLVVAQFQARQFPECIPVPNALPPYTSNFKDIQKFDKLRIGYAPSNTTLKGWNDKGYKETSKILRSIGRAFPFVEVDIITNTPHFDCMDRKARCHIFIDEVMTGSYHLNSLESLALGSIVINNIDEHCENTLLKTTGANKHPFIKSDISSLQDTLISLCRVFEKDTIQIEEKMRESLSFMNKYWTDEQVAQNYLDLYIKA